jgi:hypothetical protein
VIIDRDGEYLLRVLLADDVLVEDAVYLPRLGEVVVLEEIGPENSSSMISLQSSMHSSQMYTPGPAMSFLTWRWLFPQKEHCS